MSRAAGVEGEVSSLHGFSRAMALFWCFGRYSRIALSVFLVLQDAVYEHLVFSAENKCKKQLRERRI
ncbi:MAG: hypothetical protein ABFS03_11390 [Chloroflexota bacterium]